MPAETNKQILRRFFQAIEAGDTQVTADLIGEGVVWWVQGKGTFDKAGICATHMGLMGATNRREMKVVGEIAEGDRVAVELENTFEFKNGRTMLNTLHLAVTLKDGKIVAMREYMDTALSQAFSRK